MKEKAGLVSAGYMAYNKSGKTLAYKIAWADQGVTWLPSLKDRPVLVSIRWKKT